MAEPPKLVRCAIYTRKSTEHNLDLEFNSLAAQRKACEAYIRSQIHEGWRLIPHRYRWRDIGDGWARSLRRTGLRAKVPDKQGSNREFWEPLCVLQSG